ncbi:MAG: hypothetical protein RLZZ324_193 [Candidatus Parcubacteria bacterium]|jgi:HlyD family secretion protein
MKLPKKRYLIIGAIVLVIGGVVFAATRPKTTTYETAVIDKGSVIHEITVTGSVAPLKKISLQPEVSGRVTKINVIEGAEVKAGDVLLEIDSRDAAARAASQKAAVDSAQAQLAQLTAGATVQELAQAQSAVATAQSRYDASVAAKADAQTAYGNVQAKADSQISSKLDALFLGYDDALTAARDAVERQTSAMFTTNDFLTFGTINAVAESAATSSRTVAKGKLSNMDMLVASAKANRNAQAALDAYSAIAADVSAVKAHLVACRTVLGYTSGVSSATLSTYQSNVGTSLSALDGALQSLQSDQAALDLQVRSNDSDTSTSKAALTSAGFAVDTAQRALDQAKADLTLKQTGTRPEALAAQRANVAAQQATLDGLYATLAKYRLVAPLDATVTGVNINLGETTQPGKAAVELNSHGQFEIVANVSEVDIARVQVGQPVDITLDAFPATQHWSGKVSFINPSEKVVEGVIFYETKFVFDKEDPGIRSGMTANLSVQTDKRDDVVRVPLRALKEKSGKPYVSLMGAGGKPADRDISVGVENSQYSEVLSGLNAGDTVVVGSVTK